MADYHNQSIFLVSRREKADPQIPSLCLQCRGIRPAFLNIRGGYFHHGHFYEVVANAEHCLMCRLIRDGLRRNFADKPRNVEGGTALDLHLKSHRNGLFQLRPVMIKPCVVGEGAPGQGRRVGLKVYITGVVSCLLNCWPEPDNYLEAVSAIRPVGLEKLLLARRWFEQSQGATNKPNSGFHHEGEVYASCPPTRLIYLGEGQNYPPGSVRLVCSWGDHEHRPETPRYIALSHRWGSSQHLTTKKSNYVYHLIGIKFLELPRTFQDAATVALSLGIQHLWIDALCIIQDDTTDWHREALLMGQIYEGAACTIAVHNARDDDEGFLMRSLSPPSPILLGDELKGGRFYVNLKSDFKAEVDNSELSGRGWVLQERFLSQKTLHFTQESIFFEDANGVKSEEDSFTGATLPIDNEMALASISGEMSIPRKPWMDVAFVDEKDTVWNFAVMHSLADEEPIRTPGAMTAFNMSYTSRSGNPQVLLTRWLAIVERYSKTVLTFEKDKLPAISGLARYIRNYTSDQYFSGIWKKQYYFGLIWAPDSDGVKRATSSRAPSWSWASVDGPVQYPQFHEEITPHSLLMLIEPHGDPFYASSASITILTRIKRVKHMQPVATVMDKLYKPIPNAWRILDVPPKYTLFVHRPDPQPMGWFAIDDKASQDQVSNIYCARIAKFFLSSDIVLMLCPTGKAENEYRRVGLGMIGGWPRSGEFWDDGTDTSITIV